MENKDKIFAMMAIAEKQQEAIDNAIVKMTTMAEDITAENQKLFNENMTKQVKAHKQMMENVNTILAKRVWTSQMIYTFVACVCICVTVLAGTWGYEQYLMNDVVTLSLKKEQMTLNVQNLERHGGESKLSICDGHTCIRIDSRYGKFSNQRGEDYYVIG